MSTWSYLYGEHDEWLVVHCSGGNSAAGVPCLPFVSPSHCVNIIPHMMTQMEKDQWTFVRGPRNYDVSHLKWPFYALPSNPENITYLYFLSFSACSVQIQFHQ